MAQQNYDAQMFRLHQIIWSCCNSETHLLIHSGEKVHQCAECNKSFGRNDILMNHILTHWRESARLC